MKVLWILFVFTLRKWNWWTNYFVFLCVLKKKNTVAYTTKNSQKFFQSLYIHWCFVWKILKIKTKILRYRCSDEYKKNAKSMWFFKYFVVLCMFRRSGIFIVFFVKTLLLCKFIWSIFETVIFKLFFRSSYIAEKWKYVKQYVKKAKKVSGSYCFFLSRFLILRS